MKPPGACSIDWAVVRSAGGQPRNSLGSPGNSEDDDSDSEHGNAAHVRSRHADPCQANPTQDCSVVPPGHTARFSSRSFVFRCLPDLRVQAGLRTFVVSSVCHACVSVTCDVWPAGVRLWIHHALLLRLPHAQQQERQKQIEPHQWEEGPAAALLFLQGPAAHRYLLHSQVKL